MRGRLAWIIGFGLIGVAGMFATVGRAQLTPQLARPQGIARQSTAMQVFLKLVPAQKDVVVVGESLDKAHAGEIAIQSYSFGTKNPTTIGSATGGAGAGKAKFEELQLVHSVDKASPALFKSMCRGAHFTEAILTVRLNGIEFQRLRLGTAFITSINQSGQAGNEPPTETITLVYAHSSKTTKAPPVRRALPPPGTRSPTRRGSKQVMRLLSAFWIPLLTLTLGMQRNPIERVVAGYSVENRGLVAICDRKTGHYLFRTAE